MKAVRYHEQGEPSVLRVDDVPQPSPQNGEVLVEVHAASVNPIDTKFRNGFYSPPELPMTTGSDFSGVVVEVGDGVDEFSAGDRIIGDGLNKRSGYQGSFSEYAIAPLESIAPIPDGVSFADAAALGHAGLTAWCGIVAYGDVTIGDTCLVHGGSGGVGHVAVQLARQSGAKVIATAGTDRGLEQLEELDVDHAISYERNDLQAAIEEAGAPDVILDPLLGEYLELDIDVAAPNATIVAIEGREVTFTNAPTARRKDLGLYQVGAASLPDVSGALERLAILLDRGLIEVVINREFELEEAAEAQRFTIEENDFGKVLVRVR
ncbi:quinone oxidoreductase family protein [Natrarchaeobius oligotrophus]|uniref:NADPH:quinone reductase n=1 Tax=Natrarchaeobius chitinivorans TaxID=1679083 RepID=A0A3N6N3T4_NATCH|nr:zinc-binding dehydrogenase [Natrarchaeobius chitinivorans]RQH02337.1 NADPH:quinone reductase [Natrarchaeobius chitinivorans]